MSARQTREEFIKKCNKIWDYKNDYSKTNYQRNCESVTITCKQHGDFKQVARNHYYFEGCTKCFAKKQSKKFLYTTDKFIQKSNLKHKNFYDYSESKYTGAQKPITIICPLHGKFTQLAENHWSGSGCPTCAKEKSPGAYFNKFFERYPEKKNIPGILYFIKMETNNETFYKLGITAKTLKERYSGKKFKNFKITKIWTKKSTLEKVFLLEKSLLKKYKNFKVLPKINFNGRRECFNTILNKP